MFARGYIDKEAECLIFGSLFMFHIRRQAVIAHDAGPGCCRCFFRVNEAGRYNIGVLTDSFIMCLR